MHAPGLPQESLEHNGTRTSRPAKPSPNPDIAGPIVCSLMDHLVAAGCDTAWDRTRICSNTASTAMQCIRTVHHSGGPDNHQLMKFRDRHSPSHSVSDESRVSAKSIYADSGGSYTLPSVAPCGQMPSSCHTKR
jgi:hypothetical protein